MFPELRDDQARPEGRLPELLGRVSKQLGASGRLVIVVDGPDETRAEPGENPLSRFLPHVVPAGSGSCARRARRIRTWAGSRRVALPDA
jgi:hypothetical protein